MHSPVAWQCLLLAKAAGFFCLAALYDRELLPQLFGALARTDDMIE